MMSGIGASSKVSQSPSAFSGVSEAVIGSVIDVEGSDFQSLECMDRVEFVQRIPTSQRRENEDIDPTDTVTEGRKEEGQGVRCKTDQSIAC